MSETKRVRSPKACSNAVEVELAFVVDRHDAERRPGLLANELPRDDVGVVLHPGEHDLVARPEVGAAPALGDEVDALGAAAREDHLARLAALMKRWRRCRAPSYARVARSLSRWVARWMFALSCS